MSKQVRRGSSVPRYAYVLRFVNRHLHVEVSVTHPPEREIGRELTGAMHQSTGSYELVVAAVAAAGLGFWIDNVLGLVPLFTLIFAIAGFIGAGYSIYLNYTKQMSDVTADRDTRRDGDSS